MCSLSNEELFGYSCRCLFLLFRRFVNIRGYRYLVGDWLYWEYLNWDKIMVYIYNSCVVKKCIFVYMYIYLELKG